MRNLAINLIVMRKQANFVELLKKIDAALSAWEENVAELTKLRQEAAEHAVFDLATQQAQAELDELAERIHFGVATDTGGRSYQDDRATAFSLRARLPGGHRLSVGAVMDGNHGDQISDLVARQLPSILAAAVQQHNGDVVAALATSIRALDDAAFAAHAAGLIPTGGTTVIILALFGSQVVIANVGDCKALLSSKGAPEPLSEAHNPPVEGEKQRFEAAGVVCFGDHIGDCDINVCRTIGDYDLGPPMKWRAPVLTPNTASDVTAAAATAGTGISVSTTTVPCGPLISEPEITIRQIDAIDEFIVVGSDGLYDYYTPESSVVTEARRRLRAAANDAQACAEWLVEEALVRQRGTLHEGTPGDNVTVMVVRLRPLPEIPRTSASRLNLGKRASEDAGDGSASQSSLLSQSSLASQQVQSPLRTLSGKGNE